MTINAHYVAVTKVDEPKKEGFETVDVQDSFICKGKVHLLPDAPVYISNRQIFNDNIVLFAKYSPDTHEVEQDGVKMKFVNVNDLLAVL